MSDEPLGRNHKPLREMVTEAIREQIVSGRYAPGDHLTEDHIAAELEVSRNPVREGLHILAAEGFVELEPRRGARVAAIRPERARELFEVRGVLEGLVAALAAARRSSDQLTALQALGDLGGEAVARAELDTLPMLNTQFHDLLAETAGNALLASTLQQLSGVIRWIYAERLTERVNDSWTEHRAIIAAIAAGDATAARQLAEGHVAAARDAYLGS